jgi:phospholipase C
MHCRLFISAALLGANVALAVSWFGPRPRPDPNLLLDDSVAAALRALGREELREPGSRPYAHLPEGTDTLPGIEHIVVLMMENHSFDNIFGMLGRGDGFTLDRYGKPINTNSYPNGTVQHAFPMPNTCQLPSQPSQEWSAGHNAFDNGTNSSLVLLFPRGIHSLSGELQWVISLVKTSLSRTTSRPSSQLAIGGSFQSWARLSQIACTSLRARRMD